jgi:hypothetical protein
MMILRDAIFPHFVQSASVLLETMTGLAIEPQGA